MTDNKCCRGRKNCYCQTDEISFNWIERGDLEYMRKIFKREIIKMMGLPYDN